MARLFTTGAETKDATLENVFLPGNGGFDTGTVRSGAVSYKCDSTGSNTLSQLQVNVQPTQALGVTYYARMYINFTTLPTAAGPYIMGTAARYAIRYLLSDNLLHLTYNGTNIGTGIAISTGTWYRLELAWKFDTGALDYGEARLDGVSFASETGATRADTVGAAPTFGLVIAPGANIVCYLDDVAWNDSTGGSQNSWPGDSKQVLLLPTADSAVGTGWTLGTGTAISSNGWDAVNNTPPLGVADLGAGSNAWQIRNASSNANVNYDATMTTYAAAGVGPSDRINLVDPIVATAAPVSTSAKQGTVGVASNPTITNVALAAGGTAGAFWSGLAGAGYPTGWKVSHGTVTYEPVVTPATAPVMRITQVTSSTRIAVVCFMGMYVDYTPLGPYPPLTRPQAMSDTAYV